MRKAIVADVDHAVSGHVVPGGLGVRALVFLWRVGQEDVRVLETSLAPAQSEGKTRDLTSRNNLI